ncbi:hypothetical protein [Nesterenkonia flava]|uniref:Phage head morphogenesis domain-containing protein n=1 Tax=Nesterenkonia flava TaxID=469799 RepID=A0ABU1FT54_9MICC|nr:hypothetical protein [Nesterenkonia flava]MDR5711412.1 hypothetical protein [Nesterenkonia flava]
MTPPFTVRDQLTLAALLAADEDQQLIFLQDQHAAGLAPSNATRPLHEHELRAQARFADLESDRDAAIAQLEPELQALHDLIKDTYTRELFGDDDDPDAELPADEAIQRVHHLTTHQPEEVQEAEQRLLPVIAGVLAAQYVLGGRRVIQEAERQGIPTSNTTPSQVGSETFQPGARAVTTHPWRRIGGKVEETFTRPETITRGSVSRRDVNRIMDTIVVDGTKDEARQQINGVGGIGRIETVEANDELEPDEIWASAIMDGYACESCGGFDGVYFATLEEARSYFPQGQNIMCQGGGRCRCLLVFIFRDPSASA